jgi:plasmid stabilization system protein ParE
MINTVLFHELAESELNEIVQYYESHLKGLGNAFLSEVERGVKLILQNPESGPRIYKVVRRKTIRRFPYSIMYSISSNSIRILAIAHHKRRPTFWRKRK